MVHEVASPGLVSVIVPTHHRPRAVQGAIASLLEQTHTAIEIIVVDDGSDDDTFATIAPLVEADCRVRYLRSETPTGPSGARNRGLSRATG